MAAREEGRGFETPRHVPLAFFFIYSNKKPSVCSEKSWVGRKFNWQRMSHERRTRGVKGWRAAAARADVHGHEAILGNDKKPSASRNGSSAIAG